MSENAEIKSTGILRIFLSSTFRDLKDVRKSLLKQLGKAFESIGMEIFIPTGEHSQEIALDELIKSDIVIFLISPSYGSNIDSCKYKDRCKADCGMKTGREKISYTWCEYRFSLAEGKPHMNYIIDETWPSEDGAPKLWKFRKEIEKEFCPRVKKDDWQSITKDVILNTIKWYSKGKINLRGFCGRRNKLEELFNKLERGCVEVYGAGGIGKTTLSELVLSFYNVLGKKIIYITRQSAYSSGTGLRMPLNPKQFKSLSIDTIIDALDMPPEIKKEDTKSKIDNIISKLEDEQIILFIDDVKENDDLDGLIKRGNNLLNGSILVTSKKQLGLAQFRLPLYGVDDRECLVKIMASRLGKFLGEDEVKIIGRIAEGHPVATYLLVSNLERVGIKTLSNFKEGLEFSRDEDVREYMDRVFTTALSKDAYSLLKSMAIISDFDGIESVDLNIIYEILSKKNALMEIIDANIIKRDGDKLLWELNQFQDALFKDPSEGYSLAYQYYRKRYESYKKVEDKIKILICECNINYNSEIYNQFIDLYRSINPMDPAYELLPILAEEIINHLKKEEKTKAFFILGNIHLDLSNYKAKAENCKKAIDAYKEALKVRTLERFPMQYAMTQNNLGVAYRTLGKVENKEENCKEAIKAYKEALKVYTEEKFPEIYPQIKRNIDILRNFCNNK